MDQKHTPELPTAASAEPVARPAASTPVVSTLSGSGVLDNANADAASEVQFDAPDSVVVWRATSTAPAVALVQSGEQLRSVSLRTGATRTAATFRATKKLRSLYVCPRDNSLWATTYAQVVRLTATVMPSTPAGGDAGHREFTAEVIAGTAIPGFADGNAKDCKFHSPHIIAVTDTAAGDGKDHEREIIIAEVSASRAACVGHRFTLSHVHVHVHYRVAL